jgi:hypothetical protein
MNVDSGHQHVMKLISQIVVFRKKIKSIIHQ